MLCIAMKLTYASLEWVFLTHPGSHPAVAAAPQVSLWRVRFSYDT